MRIKNSVEIRSGQYGTDASELIEVMRRIPEDAVNIKHKVTNSPADRPWESDAYGIVIEWEIP